MRPDESPLLRATANDMAVAPELAVLVALDAVLVTAAFQLAVANPEITLDGLARAAPPTPESRKASFMLGHFAELRNRLREYRNLTLHGDENRDDSF